MAMPPPTALHSADQAAEMLGVPAPLIRKWRRLGKAMPAGMLRAPVPGGLLPLYHLEELEPLAREYHERLGRRASR